MCTSRWLILASLIAAPVCAQSAADSLWLRSLGGGDQDFVTALRPTPDAGYVLVSGAVPGFGGTNVVRTDSTGMPLWSRTVSGPGQTSLHDVAVLPDGYLLAGTTYSAADGGARPLLMRLDLAGDSLWTRAIEEHGEGGISAVRVVPTAGFVCAGWSQGTDAQGLEVSLLRADESGHLLWARSYGRAGSDWATDLCVTADGFALAVQSEGAAGGTALGLLETDAQGALRSFARRAAPNLIQVHGIAETADGFVVSWTAGGWEPGAGLDRWDNAGHVLWTQSWGLEEAATVPLLLRVPEYGYLLASCRISLGQGPRVLQVLKVDPEGGLRLNSRCEGLGHSRWDRRHGYWRYVGALPFGRGLNDFFHAPCPPPATWFEIVPSAPTPVPPSPHTRAWRGFSNAYFVRFDLARRQRVTIALRDCRGRVTAVLADQEFPAGGHLETLDGWALPVGIYFLHAHAEDLDVLQKVVLVR